MRKDLERKVFTLEEKQDLEIETKLLGSSEYTITLPLKNIIHSSYK